MRRDVAEVDVLADRLRIALDRVAVAGAGGERDFIDVIRPLLDVDLAELQEHVLATDLADVAGDLAAGQPLLEPRGRGVRLTKAGQVLAGHAERILAQVADAKADLELLREDVIGPLRIGAIPTTVHALLPPALATLAERHPRLEVTLH